MQPHRLHLLKKDRQQKPRSKKRMRLGIKSFYNILSKCKLGTKSKEDNVKNKNKKNYCIDILYLALLSAARSSTFTRSRRSKIAYGDGSGSPGSSQQSFQLAINDNMMSNNNKGLGILSNNAAINTASSGAAVGASGIRSGMANLGLASSATGSDVNNNNMNANSTHAKSSGNTTGGTASRMMARRTRR